MIFDLSDFYLLSSLDLSTQVFQELALRRLRLLLHLLLVRVLVTTHMLLILVLPVMVSAHHSSSMATTMRRPSFILTR